MEYLPQIILIISNFLKAPVSSKYDARAFQNICCGKHYAYAGSQETKKQDYLGSYKSSKKTVTMGIATEWRKMERTTNSWLGWINPLDDVVEQHCNNRRRMPPPDDEIDIMTRLYIYKCSVYVYNEWLFIT